MEKTEQGRLCKTRATLRKHDNYVRCNEPPPSHAAERRTQISGKMIKAQAQYAETTDMLHRGNFKYQMATQTSFLEEKKKKKLKSGFCCFPAEWRALQTDGNAACPLSFSSQPLLLGRKRLCASVQIEQEQMRNN